MVPWNQARILLATALLNIPLCTSKIFGNVSTYIYSVYFSWNSSEATGFGPPWMLAFYITGMCLSMLPADLIKSKIGLQLTCFFGVVFYSMAYFLTYFTVQHSAWATAMTLMAMSAVGDGLVIACCLDYLTAWFDKQAGLAISVVLAFNGAVGVLLNQVITVYVNPNNTSPDILSGGIYYFSQTQLLARVPMMFVVIGAIQTGILLLGFSLLKMPSTLVDPCHHQKEESNKEGRYWSQMDTSLNYSTGNGDSSDGHSAPLSSPSETTWETYQTFQRSSHTKEHSNVDQTPLQVLKSETFYLIWFLALAQAFGVALVTTYYKLFGQIWISDDQFLAGLGSFMALAAVIPQIACGLLTDKFGLKLTIIGHVVIETVLLATWYFTAKSNKWLFSVWTTVLLCTFNDQYVILSLSALKLFGETYYSTNLGLFMTSMILATLGGSPFMMYIQSYMGWFQLFFIAAALNFICLVFIILRLTNAA